MSCGSVSLGQRLLRGRQWNLSVDGNSLSGLTSDHPDDGPPEPAGDTHTHRPSVRTDRDTDLLLCRSDVCFATVWNGFLAGCVCGAEAAPLREHVCSSLLWSRTVIGIVNTTRAHTQSFTLLLSLLETLFWVVNLSSEHGGPPTAAVCTLKTLSWHQQCVNIEHKAIVLSYPVLDDFYNPAMRVGCSAQLFTWTERRDEPRYLSTTWWKGFKAWL